MEGSIKIQEKESEVGFVLPEPPPFDVERYCTMQLRRGCERFELTDPEYLSADQVRAEYFEDAMDTAQFIRETQVFLDGMKTEKFTKKVQRELDEKRRLLRFEMSGMGAFLIETENYFGTPSAEFLRYWLSKLFDMHFDSDYRLLPTHSQTLFSKV